MPACSPGTSPSKTLLLGHCPPQPPFSLRGHPLPLIPQQQLGRAHSTFIELTHLRLHLSHSLERSTQGSPQKLSLSLPFPSHSMDVLGFRLGSRHAHKQQRKLASLAGNPAQQLGTSWRRALKAIGQIEFSGERKAVSSWVLAQGAGVGGVG